LRVILVCLLSILAVAAAVSCALVNGVSQSGASSAGIRTATGPDEFNGITRTSFYLPMRDGVLIATDLYLPKGRKPGQKIPAILEQNRYGRRLELRGPLGWVIKPTPGKADLLVRHGYAWIETDVRGSGASFGQIPYPWSPDEIHDGADIVNWIVRQPWSNGKVGAIGTSYVGVSAELLLANDNPHLIAAAPMFAWWDMFTSESFPGGIYLQWLIPRWNRIGYIVDHNATWMMSRYFRPIPYVVRGIPPVDDDPNRTMLAAAIAQHNNVDVEKYLSPMTYRDDRPTEMAGIDSGFTAPARDYMRSVFSSGGGGVELSDPARHQKQIEASGAALYNIDGWYDGPTARSALQRFMDLHNPQRMLIGPWIHANTRNVMTGERLDTGPELLRFFDYELKGTDNGYTSEPQLTYYTMVENKWKTSSQWPLAAQIIESFYLRSNRSLSDQTPQLGEGGDSYVVDYTAGTGHHSRWEPLIGGEFSGGSSELDYGDRRDPDRKLLVYDSGALSSDTEVTGHPIVRLYVTSTADDGYFFAYLEDIAPDGRITYVTEGELRAIDRKKCVPDTPFFRVVPCHSFLRKDRSPLEPGKVAELRFDLYPTSYLFLKSHAIRLAIAGADRDHFPIFPGTPPMITVQHNAAYQSRIELPVIPR
jgi:uncharacterized protein